MQYAWEAMLRVATQARFEVQNAATSICPDRGSMYAIEYWRKYVEPWAVSAPTYRVPQLQDLAFASDPMIYIQDTDYTLAGGYIVWTVLGPADGDMELAGTASWSAINGAVLAKNAVEQHSGSQCLKITADAADEGVKPALPFKVDTGDNLRLAVYLKSSIDCRLQLLAYMSYGAGTGTGGASSWTDPSAIWIIDEHAGRKLLDGAGEQFSISSNTSEVLTLASGTPTSGSYVIYDPATAEVLEELAVTGTGSYAQQLIVGLTASNSIVTQTAATVKVLLDAAGDVYADAMYVTRYPRNATAWAPIVQNYNQYMDRSVAVPLNFRGLNDGLFTPEQAKNVARALNYSYRGADTELGLKVGLTAILGLPIAPQAGTIAGRSTSGQMHLVTIQDSDGVDHVVEVAETLCELADLPGIGGTVARYEPLIAGALKVKERGGERFVPLTDSTYPPDGDMELADTDSWSAINGATLDKNTEEQHTGARCLRVTTDAAGEGVKPATNKGVTAGDSMRYEFYLKVLAGCVVRADVIDVTQAAVIASEWFGDTSYEEGVLRFTVPAGCLNTRVEFITIEDGVFYLDEMDLYQEELLTSFYGDVTGDKEFSTYDDTPLVANDLVGVRNLSTGTKEVRQVTGVASASSPYTKKYTLDDDLAAAYIAAYTGTGTGGINSWTDSGASWDTDEHQGKILVDAADDSWPVVSNTGTVLTLDAGGETPTSGSYIIVGDHQLISWDHQDAQYVNKLEVYLRFAPTYEQENVDRFVEYYPCRGYKLVFKDVSP